MFTGRVTEVGTVAASDRGLVIEAPKTSGGLSVGGSVCVNGGCLSAVEVGDGWFRIDVSGETVNRSTLSGLGKGQRVNLELPAGR
jgi:riboflavin synthase